MRGEPGHDIVPELYPVEGEVVVDKPMRSAFAWTDFELLLRNRGVRNLVVSLSLRIYSVGVSKQGVLTIDR